MDELNAAYARCETIAAGHYENFRIGSWLMPRETRRHLAALYAFARGADDLADEPDAPRDRLGALNRWEDELDRALAGESDEPVFLATAHTLREKDLEVALLRDLLTAFRYDAAFVPYPDYRSLRAYCANSANPVGRLVLRLLDVRDSTADALSDEVCTGLQLANFWQDLSEDLPQERVYIPRARLQKHGLPVTATELLRVDAESFAPLRRELLEWAEALLRQGLKLQSHIPRRHRLDIRLYALGGLAIAKKTSRSHLDILHHRPHLEKWARLQIVLRALLPTPLS